VGFDLDLTLRRGERTIAARVQRRRDHRAGRPSGVGKTSVLMMVAGLVRPDAGRIAVGGEVLCDAAQGVHLPPEQRACGMVFQDHRLFPHLSVQANLRYGMRGGDGCRWRLPGHRSLAGRMPRSLSGGEAQRVALGRACSPLRAFC
jgi:molybdate transport system ATP-binding protein